MSSNLTFTLKAVINKHKTRVLFAEFDNYFADVLLAFVTLPLGLFVRALVLHYGDNAPIFGGLNNLYNGFTKFGSLHSYRSKVLLQTEAAYRFPFSDTHSFSYQPANESLGDEYFWVLNIFSRYNNKSFFIFDDLRIVANGKGSILQTLNNIGVAAADMDGAEKRNVTLGVNQVMNFLLRLLISRCPLSDIVLGTPENSEQGEIKSEAGFVVGKDATPNDMKMNLKATFQKSTKKFLFAEADNKFVSYLYSFLRTPLGRVDCHLGGNTFFNKIDTLYRSVTALVPKYLRDEDGKAETFFLSYYSEGMYLLTDDFTLMQPSLFVNLSILDGLKVSVSDVEEVDFQIGSEKALSFLKICLTSANALTDGLIYPLLKTQQKPKQEK